MERSLDRDGTRESSQESVQKRDGGKKRKRLTGKEMDR